MQFGFPDPHVPRFPVPVRYLGMSFTTFGNSIFIATNPHCPQTPILIYDTGIAGITIGPSLPCSLLGGIDIFVATGDKLYALTSRHAGEQHSFEAMSWAATGSDELWDPRPAMDWSWKRVPSPPPFAGDDIISSYALHPDGHTIFMYAHNSLYQHVPKGTFSFDTKRSEGLGRRRQRRKPSLEGAGRGPSGREQNYTQSELDAWIGFRKEGYICACEVASRSRECAVQPDWKIAKEKMFIKVPERRPAATRVTLACMGNMESTCIFDCCMLHMSTSGLKYDHRGELQTTRHCSNSCVVSKHILSFSPAVFWM
ncbi:hypothetical protein VPH35_026633 [Triticum aestivum]